MVTYVKDKEVLNEVGSDEPACRVYVAGTYYCVITDALNNLNTTEMAIVNPPLHIDLQPSNVNLKTGDTTACIAGGGTAPYTYLWHIVNPDGTKTDIPAGSEPEVFDPSAAGVPAGSAVSCMVIDKKGKWAESDVIYVYDAEPLSVTCTAAGATGSAPERSFTLAHRHLAWMRSRYAFRYACP